MGRKKKPFYGDGHFSKSKTVHRTKKAADKVAKSCEISGVAYRIRKVQKGWRVDKRF